MDEHQRLFKDDSLYMYDCRILINNVCIPLPLCNGAINI